ncbi:MAG: hypothetical protein LUF33_05265 [Clostridiales bacterium]|nr:hypothetical protein [Clostridiales bacterium]
MNGKKQFDSSFLTEYQDDLNNVFKMYIEDINPLIVEFESSKNIFPAEVLNEIRAMYGHLARASMSNNESDVSKNIQKLKSHSKRALLDCLKYKGIIYHDEYTDFMHRYREVDLTLISRGEFLKNAVSLYNTAVDLWQEAKIAETSDITEEELYDKYQLAYSTYSELHDLLQETEKEATYFKHKAVKKEIISKWGFIVGVVGLLVGIVGIIVGILGPIQ